MRKRIIEHIKTGRTKEAVSASLALSLKRDAKEIHNDLVQISGRLCRAEREYLLGSISWDEKERVEACATLLITEFFPLLKKNIRARLFTER